MLKYLCLKYHSVLYICIPLCPDSADDVSAVSNHPPHLIEKRGNLSPSAFIPFCSYSSDMDTTGQLIDGLQFPVCTKFHPTVLDGELCYTLDISSLDTKAGKEQGLLLLLDFNQERNIQVETNPNTK